MEGGEVRMSQTIDERVVGMQFNNAAFEAAAQKTLGTLDMLKKSLNFGGTTKNLQDLDHASKAISLAGLADGVNGIAGRFTNMGIMGVTALANIANKAVDAGITLVKSLTIDPIKAGFDEYETQLNSVQTILANTASKGGTLKTVNRALLELNNYSDKTIYNFSEMARNIGTFTAAGVGLNTSVSAIKGIANLAAVSGSNAQQASTAMYQLSQAIAAGAVKLQDWNSVVNAGMGGEVFKKALLETAAAHGAAVGYIQKDMNKFRESLKDGWLTGKVLTETLSKFTGDLTDKQLKQMGYSQKQIVEIQKMAKVAQDAATKVKTFSQLIGTLQEAVGSGWSQTWQTIFGDFEGAKKLFTGINDTLGKMINDSSKARNDLLKGWDDKGGRALVVKALGIGFKNLMAIMKPLGEAFEQIFPPKTVTDLTNMSNAFYNFMKRLKLGKVDTFNLKETFKGLFALWSIGYQVVGGFLGMLKDLFNRFTQNHSGILEFTAGIGEWLVNIDWALKKGAGLSDFFDYLGNIIAVPIKLIKTFGTFLKDAFNGLNMNDLQKFFEGLGNSFKPLADMGPKVAGGWSAFLNVLQKIKQFFQPVIDQVAKAFSWLGDSIKALFAKMDLKNLFAAGNLAAQGGILWMIFNWIKEMKKKKEDATGFKKSFLDLIDGLTGSLKAMQQSIKASAIMKIAAAVLFLAIGVAILSSIEPSKMAASLGAMAAMFTMLFGFLAAFEKFIKGGSVIKMAIVAPALVLLAISVDILASAVKKLSDLSWEQLAKGLVGVGGILVGLVLFTKFADANKKAVKTGKGLLLLALAVWIMASAVTMMGKMDPNQIIQGVLALTAILGVLAGFVKVTSGSEDIVKVGFGLLLLSIAMNAIAASILILGSMSWDTLGRGLVGMATALVVIVAAMDMMPEDMGSKAGALIVVSIALTILAGVLAILGGMSWESIAKGVLGLAATLVMLAVALDMMDGALAGAAALIVAALALAILAPVLLLFSKMSWEEIGKGLVMLAGTLIVLGIAGMLMAPVAVVLLAVGAAILLLGIGIVLAAQGIVLFAAGLAALTLAMGAGMGAITLGVMALLSLIPYAMEQIGLGIVAMIGVFAASTSTFIEAFVMILMSLLTAVNIVAPALISTLTHLILLLVAAIVVLVPRLVDAGMKLLTGILRGIANNIGKLIDAATNVILEFLKGLARNIPKIIQGGVDLIISLVKGLAKGIRDNQKKVGEAAGDLADALIDGLVNGVAGGVDLLLRAARRLADDVIGALMRAWKINSPSKVTHELGGYFSQGAGEGITALAGTVTKAATSVGKGAVSALKAAMAKVPDAVNAEVNLTPKIQPVLDLSAVKKDASTISGIIGSHTLPIDKAFAVASNISVAQQRANDAKVEPAQIINKTEVSLTQNNHSPEALSEIEIYRQTNNLMSTLKGAVTV